MIETVDIERMATGPEAVAHLSSGKAVFVKGAAPGDIAEIKVTEEKPSYAKATLVKIIEPSPERGIKYKQPSCDPSETAMAPWAHLTYAAQLKAKADNVRSALKRTAHLSSEAIDSSLHEIVPSEQEWSYRNKLEFATKLNADNRICIGIHAEGTHDFVPVKDAPLGNSLISKSPKAIQGALRYLCGTEDLGIYRVGIRASENTKSIELALWTPPSSFPRSFTAKLAQDGLSATSVVRVLAEPGSSRKVKRVEVLGGDGFWHEQMTDNIDFDGIKEPDVFDFRVSAPSFFQVNTLQAQNMVGLVLQGLGISAGARIADLYSGVGTFSFPLAASGAEVTAIELEGSSSRDFKKNVELNQLAAEIVCDDVARALPSVGRLDAVVVDPPRSGLDAKVISQLVDCAPEKIAYVSCDVQTLARDIARLASSGFALESVTPVDMFPQTYHIECICIFSRDSKLLAMQGQT